MRVVFDSTPCTRCGGTGQMPYAVYGGVCLKCRGAKRRLTAKGRAATKRYLAWREAALQFPITRVTEGMVIRLAGHPDPFAPVLRVGFSSAQASERLGNSSAADEVALEFPRIRHLGLPLTQLVERQATVAELRAAAPSFGAGARLVE